MSLFQRAQEITQNKQLTVATSLSSTGHDLFGNSNQIQEPLKKKNNLFENTTPIDQQSMQNTLNNLQSVPTCSSSIGCSLFGNSNQLQAPQQQTLFFKSTPINQQNILKDTSPQTDLFCNSEQPSFNCFPQSNNQSCIKGSCIDNKNLPQSLNTSDYNYHYSFLRNYISSLPSNYNRPIYPQEIIKQYQMQIVQSKTILEMLTELVNLNRGSTLFGNNNYILNPPTTTIINLPIKVCEPYQIEFIIIINKKETIVAMKKIITERLKILENNPSITPNSFILMNNYTVVKIDGLVEELNLYPETSLYVIHNKSITQSELELEEKEKLQVNPNNLTKKKYQTSPSLSTLNKMDPKQLKELKDFQIFNEHGKIYYNEPVDLTVGLMSLDNIFLLEPGDISIFHLLDKKKAKYYKRNVTIHVFNIENDQTTSLNKLFTDKLTLSYQLDNCKIVGGSFKEYITSKREFIYHYNEL